MRKHINLDGWTLKAVASKTNPVTKRLRQHACDSMSSKRQVCKKILGNIMLGDLEI